MSDSVRFRDDFHVFERHNLNMVKRNKKDMDEQFQKSFRYRWEFVRRHGDKEDDGVSTTKL